MTDSTKATRATVAIGSLTIDGFMLPDGSYRMSQTQAAECIGKPEINARRFLDSKAIKALLGKGYTPDSIEIESDREQVRGQSRFNALPIEVVTAYWFSQANQGNQQAIALAWALMTESLERRFDAAFGIPRSDQERNDRLTQRVQQLERDLERLGEGFAHTINGGEPLEDKALVHETMRVAQSLPGYQDFCRHQHEIEKRSQDWGRSIEANPLKRATTHTERESTLSQSLTAYLALFARRSAQPL